MAAIQYLKPDAWIKYDSAQIFIELTNAKAAILALQSIPFQRRWVEELQKMQLKMEIAGTSQIEGADFAANELDAALGAQTAEELVTRSQRQANAAVRTYRWISSLEMDRPVDEKLISDIHRSIVTGCDDDHCEPGVTRHHDQNVTFGIPRHRGCLGGTECSAAFTEFVAQIQTFYGAHDPLIQALASHYHFAAMHPFSDGNGRTARALEAFMLRRAGLKDSLFIAMSNYYYEEKHTYLKSLANVRASDHNLTPFLKFGLTGIAVQSMRLANLIRDEVSKQIFRNMMNDLSVRLQSTRKRVIVKRQLMLLDKLLNAVTRIEFTELLESVKDQYSSRKLPMQAIARDLNRLIELGAIKFTTETDGKGKRTRFYFNVNLDWPSTITETEFFRKIAELPKSKTYAFISTSAL